MRDIMSKPFHVLLLAVLIGTVSAESVSWSPGQSIDLPLEITIVPDVIKSRTVTFPGGNIQPINGGWNKGDLEIDVIAHKAVFTLMSPTLMTPVHLHDDLGNTFTVTVRPESSRRLDAEVIVEDARNGDGVLASGKGLGGSGPVRMVDSYSEITRMFRVMMGRQNESDIRIQEILTKDAAGKMVAGEVQEDSDDLRTTILRSFTGPAMTGYEVLIEWKREYPVMLNLQQLTYDPSSGSSLVAVASDRKVILPSNGPAPTILEKHKGVRVFFLEERSE